MNPDTQPTNQSNIYNSEKSDELVALMDKRIEASKAFWNSKGYKLEETTKENEALYLAEDDDDDEENDNDNRIFSSVRTIVPYVTTRITEPEVAPSSTSQAAKRFAEDFEKALHIHAKNQKVKDKLKYSLEDAIIRRRGYLKPRYDPLTGSFCTIEYVPCESIIIDHKARPYEEPRYFRHELERSISDLLTMFPDEKANIQQLFGIDDNTPADKLDETCTVNEDWFFQPDNEEGLDLLVMWSYKEKALGVMRDPNWRYGQSNILDYHMVPLVFINVLNDGRTFIDRTSFVEQAAGLQRNVDRRTAQISTNAGLGSVGMPVVDAAALSDEQSQSLTFDPDTVLVLDVSEANGSSINDVFTQWKASALPKYVYDDKLDSRNSIDNTFGTPNVFRGEQSDNNTLGQDVLVRDQAFGRQQEIVDAIDAAMSRLYLLMAQFLLVYGDEEELFTFVGEHSEFDYVIINTPELDTNVSIRVKGGTSMPIDRAQRRATAAKAAENAMIDPLTYWEIMDEGNAEKYARRVVQFTADPAGYMKETADETVFNRDAYVDIQTIKNGEQPPYRDELPKEYFDYLNHYVLSGALENPTLDPAAAQELTAFIDVQLARGQRMLGMAETQLPTPEEVTDANAQIDEANAVDTQVAGAAKKAQPETGKQPVQLTPVQ